MHNAAVWLRTVSEEKAKQGEELDITWRHFLLDQINSKQGPDWKVWEQSEDKQGNLLAQRAGEAARKQGREVFEKYHLALLVARHGTTGRRVPLDDREALLEVAGEVGLDTDRLSKDMEDESLLDTIASDHTEAAGQYGVFGTPTFLFDSGLTVYLKMFVPPADESLDTFDHFLGLMSDKPYLGEVKRPQPPWPKGAVRPPTS